MDQNYVITLQTYLDNMFEVSLQKLGASYVQAVEDLGLIYTIETEKLKMALEQEGN